MTDNQGLSPTEVEALYTETFPPLQYYASTSDRHHRTEVR